jgi:2-polyprenyl-3-methyl-5-hydroxy-6-metoxy-1,4-benzoquinol methylase
MLEEARRKGRDSGYRSHHMGRARHHFSSGVEAVEEDVRQRRGFDIVSCCSALVLLADPARAIKKWAKLLKPGGKTIIDVPTEDRTWEYLFTTHLRDAVGISLAFDRS